jgi:hypothetical protein
MDAKPSCQKCGDRFNPGVDGRPYCSDCKKLLGLIDHSPTAMTQPSLTDYYQKQVDEPILDTWVYETYGKHGVEYDERDDDRIKRRIETRFCGAEIANLNLDGHFKPKRHKHKRAG